MRAITSALAAGRRHSVVVTGIQSASGRMAQHWLWGSIDEGSARLKDGATSPALQPDISTPAASRRMGGPLRPETGQPERATSISQWEDVVPLGALINARQVLGNMRQVARQSASYLGNRQPSAGQPAGPLRPSHQAPIMNVMLSYDC